MEGIQSTLSVFAALAPVVLVLFFSIVIYRTQSIHVLLGAAWRISAGGKTIEDEDIRRYGDDIYSLTYFRFFTNLKVASLEQARSAISWSKRVNIDLRDAGRCGDYFDVEKLDVHIDRLPSKPWRFSISAVLGLVLLVSVTLVGLASVLDVSFLRFKESGHSFMLTEKGATRYFVDSRLSAEMCGRRDDPVLSDVTQFSKNEVESLCQLLTDKNFQQSFDEMLRDQRRSSWEIAWMLFLLFLPLFVWSLKISAAQRLTKRLKDLEEVEKAPEHQA